MENPIERLRNLITNAKKSLNRPYGADTIENKEKEIENIEGTLVDFVENSELEQTERVKLLEQFERLKEEAIDILGQHLKGRTKRQAIIMANLDMNELAMITKLVPRFSGRNDELHNFISNLEIVSTTIPTDKVNSFFNFIFKSKLELKVQTRVKQIKIPTNIDELVKILKDAYKSRKTSNTILNEVTSITQKDNNLIGFASKIETLISELNEIQVAEQTEANRETIINTNSKIAFNAFINGLTDPQIVSTIYASQVTTFHEALKIAENASSRVETKRVFHQNAKHHKTNTQQSNCTKCGRSHGNKCPADGMKCHKCGKVNHFSKMCYTKGQGHNNNSGNYNNNGNYNKNNNSNNRNNNNNYNRNNNNNGNYNNRRNNNNNNNRNNNQRNRNVNRINEQGNSQAPETTHQGFPEESM